MMTMHLTPAAWIISATAMLLTGISKGGFGGVLGGIAVPLMAVYMPPSTAAAATLPMLCLMDLSSAGAYWKKWSSEDLWIMLLGSAFGIALGWLAFGMAPEWSIKLAVGAIAVSFALDRILKRKRSDQASPPNRLAGYSAGLIAGLTSTLAHAGGPPVLVYLFARKLPKERFVATVSVFFTIVNLTKLIPYVALHLFSVEVMWLCLFLSPFAPLGVWLGVKLQRRVPERPFFVATVALLGISGLQLICDALHSMPSF